MPNLNEFVKPEQPKDPGIERIDEPRPCSSCDKDSDFYYWNSSSTEMTWTCPDGHKNSYRIN
jgi:hypothetical protein